MKRVAQFKVSILNLLLILILNISVSYGQSGQCNAILKVEKDRNIRSTPQGGTYYSMILANNATVSSTFSLSSNIINNTCQNPDNSSTNQNVIINSNFLDQNLNPISAITIPAGQEIKFFIHITVPLGTNMNKWCCTQINAISILCPNYDINSVLQTLVIDSTEN